MTGRMDRGRGVERRLSHLARERRQWQDQTREFLLVGLAGSLGELDGAGTALALGRALAEGEARRSNRNVVLCELDFWNPSLAAHLGRPQGAIRRDLLTAYRSLVEDRRHHDELRQRQGLLRTHPELARWTEALRPLLPPPVIEGEHLLALPAADDGPAFEERAKKLGPERLVSYPARPAALPGISALRLLLSVAAFEHRAGVVLLALPRGWNPLTLLMLGNAADVVVLLRRSLPGDSGTLRPLLDFLAARRHGQTTRPVFEEDFTILVQPSGIGNSESSEPPEASVLGLTRWIPLPAADGRSSSSRRMTRLAKELDVLAASKAAGGVELELVSDPEAADRSLLQGLAACAGPEERRLRILVEKGPYGEYPVKRLGEATRTVLARLGEGGEGFVLEPVPRTHTDLLAGLGKLESLRTELEEERVELLTFPHYMLGTLAEAGWLLPWHLLEEALADGTGKALGEEDIERWFYQVREMCRYNGVLYAVPYSLLQKLMLVKKRSGLRDAAAQWQSLLDRIDAVEGGASSWPLLLETQLDHVGIWYDWLEFVHAFGGADFRPTPGNEKPYRGSDYGECWINHPRTVEATAFYLDLLARTHRRVREPVDWDRLIEFFRHDEKSRVTVAWSDIVAYHWRRPAGDQRQKIPEDELPLGLEAEVDAHPFPLGSADGRTSLEGWVLAAPSWLEPGRRRLVARFLAWFLSPSVQRRYAEHGGNTARRDVGHALGEIQKLVHRSILFPLHEPGLKATFREAPAVIEAIADALRGWLKPLLGNEEAPTTEELTAGLDRLARKVTGEILRDKARYRPPAHWRGRRRGEELP